MLIFQKSERYWNWSRRLQKIKLRIIVPIFNEQDVLDQFHQRVRAVLDSLDKVDGTILYVLDKSTDESLAVLTDIVAEDQCTEVLIMSSRFGHQMALIAGIENSLDADAIIMMDGDLQHPPELIPELLSEHEKGIDVVYTVRTDTEKIGFIRKLIGQAFYALLGRISNVPINANSADFRLISARVAKVIGDNVKEQNVFLRGLFSWVGFKQSRVNYIAEQRAAGESKYSFQRMMQLALAGILSFSTRPLRLGMILGLIFAVLALVLLIFTILSYFMESSIPSGWTTIVVLLLFFNALQLFVIGIIGVYVGAIYDETKARPRYIVEEVLTNNDK
jgi:dolichol-phosphate mannosyltransferase